MADQMNLGIHSIIDSLVKISCIKDDYRDRVQKNNMICRKQVKRFFDYDKNTMHILDLA